MITKFIIYNIKKLERNKKIFYDNQVLLNKMMAIERKKTNLNPEKL